MALENYLRTEKLEGSNKYHCSECDTKVDALKGLKFKSFPYFLVLQLKRFDLDYVTMQRKKLNDEVKFPEILNMNTYVKKEEEGPMLTP
jgi:ubiquitin C-terminal hydrolase